MSWLRALYETLGIGQKRCANCLEPYFPRQLVASCPTRRLCPACQTLFLPYAGPACRVCGLPAVSPRLTTGATTAAGLCGRCSNRRPHWHGRAFYGLYSGPLREMLLRLKFGSETALAHVLADFLHCSSVCLPRPDFIVAVPQHPARLARRGFNQAHEIARALAKVTGFACSASILQRVRAGVPQEGLTAAERRRNLENAFLADTVVRGRAIWLIDDVFTTGSTSAAATDALLAAGAARVYLLFVARTPFV